MSRWNWLSYGTIAGLLLVLTACGKKQESPPSNEEKKAPELAATSTNPATVELRNSDRSVNAPLVPNQTGASPNHPTPHPDALNLPRQKDGLDRLDPEKRMLEQHLADWKGIVRVSKTVRAQTEGGKGAVRLATPDLDKRLNRGVQNGEQAGE